MTSPSATLLRPVVLPDPVERSRRRWPRPTEARLLMLVSTAAYVALGAYLSLAHSTDFGDALSRVSQALFVERSRDPHLAAIGFVYGPVPSLLLLPFLPLADLWPTLLTRGFIGNIESALFMAGTLVVFRGILAELGVRRSVRLLLVALLAAHPLLLFYGGSGMSEPCELFFLMLASRALLRWLGPEPRRLSDLTLTGTACGLAYLTRLEAAAAGVAVCLLVPAVSALRHDGPHRRERAVNDALLVGLPFLLCVAGWATISKVIVGDWVGYASSSYGALAQYAAAAAEITARGGSDATNRAAYVGAQVVGLEPTLLALLMLAGVLAALRADLRVLGALACFGSVLVLTTLTFINGSTFGFLRFSASAVPLAALLAALVAAGGPATRPARSRLRWVAGARGLVAGLVAAALLAVALPASAMTLRDRRLSPQEARPIAALLHPRTATPTQLDAVRAFTTERQVAAYLDAKRLRPGSVVTDAGSAFAVVLASRRPHQFVVTPDRDFERVVADPVRFGATYLLVPGDGSAYFDAVRSAYPSLDVDGGGIASLEHTWMQVGDGYPWRLYRLRTDPT